jgi:hypothetical protein
MERSFILISSERFVSIQEKGSCVQNVSVQKSLLRMKIRERFGSEPIVFMEHRTNQIL